MTGESAMTANAFLTPLDGLSVPEGSTADFQLTFVAQFARITWS
jgi:hypothetical protein